MASNEGTKLMMVIGVDTHKSTHAMAGVAAATGLLVGEREIAASDGSSAPPGRDEPIRPFLVYRDLRR